jgi:type IV pilus assembly protein PilM
LQGERFSPFLSMQVQMRLNLPTTKKKAKAVVGLDIEAGSLAAAEVQVNGVARLGASGIAPLPPGTFHEGEVVDPEVLADSLKNLFAENKLPKQVRLGVGNQRVIVRTLRLPAIEDPKELDAAVRFQAQEQIPMPLDQAVLEHQVVGAVPGEEGGAPQVEVLVVAARREMIASVVEPVRRAGLHPAGVDLAAFGMIRALSNGSPSPGATDAPAQATLYCNLGDVTNLAVARGSSCLFTRVSHVGLEGVAASLESSLGLVAVHARQWLSHVGLERPVEEIEGEPAMVAEVRRVLEAGLSDLVDELRLSLDYYGAQEAALPVERIVLCGPGSAIPGLSQRMEAALGLRIEPALPAALEGFDPVTAARLTLPFGLALEGR